MDAKGGCKKQISISVCFEYQGLILQLDNYQEWNNSAFRIIQIYVYLTLPSHGHNMLEKIFLSAGNSKYLD